MIELYRRNVWNDAKTVNVIATACFSKVTKVGHSLRIENNFVNGIGSYDSECIYFFFLCLSLLKHKLFFISFLEMII